MSAPVESPLDLFNWDAEIKSHEDLIRLETFLSQCAERTEWTLAPWSNPAPFPTVALVSKDLGLVDQLFGQLCTMQECRGHLNYINEIRPAISRYAVRNNLSDQCRLVTIGEFGEWGHRIWESQNCQNEPPSVSDVRRVIEVGLG